MNLIVFLFLTVSVCFVSSWTIFPVQTKPKALSSKPSVSPTIVSSTTSSQFVERVPEPVALGLPPSIFNKQFKDIEPPSRELLPPKEPIVIPVPPTPWIVTKLAAPWIQKPSIDLLPPKLPNSRQLPVIASWSSPSIVSTTTTTTTTVPLQPVEILQPVPQNTISPSSTTEEQVDEPIQVVKTTIPPTTVSIALPTKISATVTTDISVKTNAPVTTTSPSITTHALIVDDEEIEDASTAADEPVTTTKSVTSIAPTTEPSVTDLLMRKIFFTNDVTKETANEPSTTVLPEATSDKATQDTAEITTAQNNPSQEDIFIETEPRTTARPGQLSPFTTEENKATSKEKTTSSTSVYPNTVSIETPKLTLENTTSKEYAEEEVPKSVTISETTLPSKTLLTLESSTTPSEITMTVSSPTVATSIVVPSSATPSDVGSSTETEVITAPSINTTEDQIPNLLTRVGINAGSSLKEINTASSSSSLSPETVTLSILSSNTSLQDKSESATTLSPNNTTSKVKPPILDLLPPKESVAITYSEGPAENPLYLDLLPPKEEYA